jgi:hypothetical protein
MTFFPTLLKMAPVDDCLRGESGDQGHARMGRMWGDGARCDREVEQIRSTWDLVPPCSCPQPPVSLLQFVVPWSSHRLTSRIESAGLVSVSPRILTLLRGLDGCTGSSRHFPRSGGVWVLGVGAESRC